MIVDSHQHFWDRSKLDYYWMSEDLGVLYHDFLPEELEPLLQRADVRKTVVVQATSSYRETDWLVKLAEGNDFIAGVVCWVDLLDEKLEDKLEQLARHPKIVGVRHQAEDEQDREWLLRREVLGSLKKVHKFGLRFDALLKHDQLGQLQRVFDACGEIGVVIDHAAKPNIHAKGFEPWAGAMETAAELPVFCKFSGLFTEAGQHWTPEDIRPYQEHLLRVFGADRLLFGSDWPVSLTASSYQDTVAVSRQLFSALGETDMEKVFAGNAVQFYGLKI